MITRNRDAKGRLRRGAGSVRERRPGVWEIRVVVANDLVTGRSVQRSCTATGILWRPAVGSWSSASVVRFLGGDRIGQVGLAVLAPADVEAALAGERAKRRWRRSGRVGDLAPALSWALAQRILRTNPLGAMRGPGGAESQAVEWASARAVVAEQTQLLVRLPADTGARRGELAVLRLGDLQGRVLSIERNVSLEVLGPTKSGRERHLTLGATTER